MISITCEKCGKAFEGPDQETAEMYLEGHKNLFHKEPQRVRRLVSFFNIGHFFSKVEPPVSGSEISKPKKIYTIWLGRPEKNQPGLFIVDRDSFVSESRLDYALLPLQEDQIKETLGHVTPKEFREIENTARYWGWKQKEDDEGNRSPIVAKEICELNIFTVPVPRLIDAAYLKDVNWKGFIDSLVAFQTEEKDERLKLVHRSQLFRGINTFIAPHSIQATDGGTGKSLFYKMIGDNIDKATASAFLGFAKSPKEVFPGTVDGTETPIGIDQIESQSASQIMRYLFNALESGEGVVSAGAVKFRVHTRSTFAMLANAVGYSLDSTKSFASLMDHMSFNPAIGRRFGIVLYGTDFSKVKKRLDPDSLEKWRSNISEFRAVEEYCWKNLQTIVHDKLVWSWINSPIENYEKQVTDLSKDLSEDSEEQVRSFLLEHAAGAQVRVRGAALYASLADHLSDIALESIDIQDLLADAEEYLSQYVQLNYDSIINICKQWSQQQTVKLSSTFNALPDYLKEIVSAIELHKRAYPQELSLTLTGLAYEPKNGAAYRTFNECLRELSRKRRSEETLSKIKSAFKFDIVKDDNGWRVTVLDAKPIQEIHPLGTLNSGLASGISGSSGIRGAMETGTSQENSANGETTPVRNSPRTPDVPESPERQQVAEPAAESSSKISKVEKQAKSKGTSGLSWRCPYCDTQVGRWQVFREHLTIAERRELPRGRHDILALEVFKSLSGQKKEPVERSKYVEYAVDTGQFDTESADKQFENMWKAGVIMEVRPGFYKKA